MTNDYLILVGAVSLIVTKVLDAAMTLLLLEAGEEQNPIWRGAFFRIGVPAGVLANLSLMAALIAVSIWTLPPALFFLFSQVGSVLQYNAARITATRELDGPIRAIYLLASRVKW